MNIKEIFEKSEDGKLTLEQFESLAKENGAKFTDLSEGKYVSTSKYNSDLKAKDNEIEAKVNEMTGLNDQIENLNQTIATRDNDLADLQKQVEAAGEDATKLAELNTSLTNLQTKYDNDVKAYQDKMNQQAYEFAVKEFANSKKFSSQAAKRDFTQAMIAKQLKMENGRLMGGEDFVSMYSEENADAFYVEPPKPEPKPEPTKQEPEPKSVPTFVQPTQGASGADDTGFHFNFVGVRDKQ